MTTKTISDAVAFPQDEGTGVPDSEEDYNSAGFYSILSKYKGSDSYVGEDSSGLPTLQFNGVDTAADEVDVGVGFAYIMESGNAVQSGFQTNHDTTLPDNIPYVVVLPSEVIDLPLDTDATNDVWLALDPTQNDEIYLKFGSGLSAPSDPSVKLGTVDTSSGATTRPNDLASPSVDTLTGGIDLDGNALVDGSRGYVELGSSDDLRLGTGQALEDGGGTKRIEAASGRTYLYGSSGNTKIDAQGGANLGLYAYSGESIHIWDDQQGAKAVQYDTDASDGILYTPNAGFAVQGGGNPPTNDGAWVRWQPSNNRALITSIEGGIRRDITFDGSLYDFSFNAANLRLATGQAIEDGGGGIRVFIGSTTTQFRNEANNPMLKAKSGDGHEIHAFSTTPITFEDIEGGFTAVQYDTDSTIGVLRVPGAGFVVQSDHQGTLGRKQGLNIRSDSGGNSIVEPRDGNGSFREGEYRGSPLKLTSYNGLIDMSSQASDLRLATGQAIEDGSGGTRINIRSSDTLIYDEAGDSTINLNSTQSYKFSARSGAPWLIQDREGGFTAVQYDTDASKGTLTLLSADLYASHNDIREVGFQTIRDSGYDSGDSFRFFPAGSGSSGHTLEISHRDDSAASATNLLNIHQGGPVEVPNSDLRLATGQAIEDGGGTRRYRVESGSTAINDETGTLGLQVWDNAGTGLFEINNRNVRIDTGQAIEDGGGNQRLSMQSNRTLLRNELGQNAIELKSAGADRWITRDSLIIHDQNGGFDAIEYIDSGSAPGTLELTNASLFLNDAAIEDVIEDGSRRPKIFTDSNGEWIARDDEGNSTTLT